MDTESPSGPNNPRPAPGSLGALLVAWTCINQRCPVDPSAKMECSTPVLSDCIDTVCKGLLSTVASVTEEMDF